MLFDKRFVFVTAMVTEDTTYHHTLSLQGVASHLLFLLGQLHLQSCLTQTLDICQVLLVVEEGDDTAGYHLSDAVDGEQTLQGSISHSLHTAEVTS